MNMQENLIDGVGLWSEVLSNNNGWIHFQHLSTEGAIKEINSFSFKNNILVFFVAFSHTMLLD